MTSYRKQYLLTFLKNNKRMKQKEEQPQKAVPVSDEELARMNGGAFFSKEPEVQCRYCGQTFPKKDIEVHERNCPAKPKSGFGGFI